jgi:serine/threonine-protein kinase RIO1
MSSARIYNNNTLSAVMQEELARKQQEDEDYRLCLDLSRQFGDSHVATSPPKVARQELPVNTAPPKPLAKAWQPKAAAKPAATATLAPIPLAKPAPAASPADATPSAEPSSAPTVSTVPSLPVPASDDADLALAFKLQDEFDNEARASGLRGPVVAITKTGVKLPEAKVTVGIPAEFELEDYDEDDDVDSDENAEELLAAQKKPHHQVVKVDGRKPVAVTKHDPAVAARNHAAKLSDLYSTFAVGNMRADEEDGQRISTIVFNSLRETTKNLSHRRIRKRDNAADAESAESVLDKRTRMMLYKLLNSGTLTSMGGAIACGKESNVYHGMMAIEPAEVTLESNSPPKSTVSTKKSAAAATPDDVEVAIKIFRTTEAQFRNKAEYIESDVRCQNPRKVIHLWAEKELGNLKRIRAAGVRAPQPLLLREHVLLTRFIGTNGIAAPQLREAALDEENLAKAYAEVVNFMRLMFQGPCRLVHADLSEYNILWHRSRVYLIDVSQAVSTSHPQALVYLRRDCGNVCSFFARKGLRHRLTHRQLFDFVVDSMINDPAAYLAGQLAKPVSDESPDMPLDEEFQAAVFANPNLSIPNSLSCIDDPFTAPSAEESFHQKLTGMRADLSGARVAEDEDGSGEEDEDEDEDEEDDGDLGGLPVPVAVGTC